MADTSMAAQPPPPGGANQIPAPPPGGANQIPASGAPIALETGKGTLIRLSRAASTVFVANPDIADVQVKSPSLIYLSAKQPGETVIYAVDANDKVLLRSPVLVEPDLSRVRQSLAGLMPDQRIRVASVAGNVILSGTVASAADAEKARALATSILGEAKNTKIIDQLVIATPNQVNLRVRIDEVDRSVLKELGINWSKFGSTLSFLTTNPTTVASESQNFAEFGRLSGQSVSAELEALAQEGFVTTLAEPNLTAMNGQKASFLAGGEFPVPIAANSAVGGVPTITVDFKTFGVSLAFTPTIIDATHLNLKIEPEVSQLTSDGAVSLPITSQSTISIPALTVRRAQTTVELASGESFALAGLLQHTSTQDISKVPGLGDIPVLGALFRSDRFQRNESELVIIVTPYLVNPVRTALASPVDGWVPPHDMQRIMTGATNRQSLPAPARGPLGAGGQGLIGPAGFRLN
ncbi:MAG TPA: type II and III secretion system protein family protein [Stellaceae bacterium]|nr:type II and III secretion system protein family protein [Stellaceae bacterium]